MRRNAPTMTRRAFLGGAAAVATGGGRRARATSSLPTRARFTLPWIPHGGFTHVFAAKKLGFWERVGLDVTIDRGFGSGEVCKSLGLGQYDFGEIDLAVMTNCASKGLDLVALGNVSPRSPVGIFALPKRQISQPGDLAGKQVGFSAGSGDFQLWPAFVKATGIDDHRVRKVMMSPEALIKALIEGQVDAVGNFYGSIAPSVWAQGLDLSVMLYEEYGVRMYSLVFATRSKVVREDPGLCARFMNGAMEGLRYVYLNPEKAVDLHLEMVRELQGPTSRDVIKHGQGIMTAMGLVPEVEQEGLGYMDRDMVRRTRETVATYMGASQAPVVDELFTNAFVGNVRLTPVQWATVKESVRRYVPLASGRG
jgi:NitT/TauT family transport system substrate-binding protein